MRSKSHPLALTLLALLSLCAACSKPPAEGGGANGRGGASGGTNTAGGGSVAAVSPNDNPKDVLTKSIEAHLNAKSLRTRMTTTSSQGTYTATLEYASPDRYHVVMPQVEMISIGSEAYMKVGERWTKSPMNVGQLINQFRDPEAVEEMRRKTDIKFVGADTLDGQAMYVYEYAMEDAAGVGARGRAKTWISQADLLPRKTEVDGEAGGIKSHTTITYSDYNSEIKIERPQ